MPTSATDQRTPRGRPPAAAGRDLDAATLAGALADDDRRRVFAAIELGAGSLDEVVRATGLSAPAASTALGRLVSVGLVVDGGGTLVVLGAAFQLAARAALSGARSTEHDGIPTEHRGVFAAFVRDGQIVASPAAHGKRMVLLDWLAQEFEPGRTYSEEMVNAILAVRHPDTAMWRRYLVDFEFLARENGRYWRIGGSVAAPGE